MRRTERCVRRGWGRVLAVAGLACAVAAGPAAWPAAAQVRVEAPAVAPAPRPEASEAVALLLAADYLTASERRDLRLDHGIWTGADLDTPSRLARASLVAGAIDDPVFESADADALDRAEAMLRRGEAARALDLVADRSEARAVRIRAEALAESGRADQAVAAAEGLIERLIAGRTATPEEVVEGVRLLDLRIRLRGSPARGGGEYQAMMRALATVREGMDRLYWPAALMEARLLLRKDNPAEAQEALGRVLELNPACAEAWAMLGRMAVDSFDFDAAEAIAARLDLLARFAAEGVAEDPAEGMPAEPARPGSAAGALVRARALLRLNDPEAAQAQVEGVLARFPAMREALALRAAAAARGFDEAGTAAALGAFDAAWPGGGAALYEVGRTLSEARQYREAAAYLARAHEREPWWPEPLIELGLLHVQSGDDGAAGDALRQATRLDPFNVRAANSLRLVEELASYARVEGEHFVVRYKPGADGVLAREMLGPLEANFRMVTGSGDGGIDCVPAERTIIDLMPDHRWFGVRIAGLPRIHTIAASTGPVIAMEAPREGAGHLGTYDWVRVLRHEYTHTVTLARTRNRIPHWFTEAAAVYQERAPRDYSTCRLLADALRNDALFDFTRINVAFVRPVRPSDRAQAYAQGHWMYEYLVARWGAGAPLSLMDLYARGVREESAFQTVLGVSREQFMAQFREWAAGQVVQWGLAERPGQPALRDLVAQARAERAADDSPAPDDGEASPPPPEADGAGGEDEPAASTRAQVARWLEQYPDHADLLEMAVTMDLDAAGGTPTAEMAPLLERYAAARPVDPMPHRLLAKFYLGPGGAAAGGAAAAIPHLEYLDARETKSSVYAVELARRYAALGQWDLAAAKAERATQVAPYEAEEREIAASVAIKRKDYDTAERHLRALVELEPARGVHVERLEALRRLREGGAR